MIIRSIRPLPQNPCPDGRMTLLYCCHTTRVIADNEPPGHIFFAIYQFDCRVVQT